MDNILYSNKFRSSLFLTILLVILLLTVTGCTSTSDDTTKNNQNNSSDDLTDDNTDNENSNDQDSNSDTGGETTGTLAGSVDSSLLSNANCSSADNANAVYIFKGDTVVAIDQSGSNMDPIEIVQVSNQYTYSISLAAGIYTLAFTCQADSDQPDQASDPVTFTGVTNVAIQANETNTHDFTISNPSGGGLNATIQAMPANSWYEVPNTQLSQSPAEAKDPERKGIWRGNFKNANGAMAFSGGAFDSKRNRLLIWGGGHHDYYGNEIYAFNLTDFSWDRVTNPSPVTKSADICTDVLSDGNPNSRHTYYNLAYIPDPVDSFFSTPAGSTSCNSGGRDDRTWMFNFSGKQKWTDIAPTGKPVINWAPTASAYDPITNQIFSVSADVLYRYNISNNHWTRLPNSNGVTGDRGVVVDTKRHLLVVVGRGEVVVYDIGNESYQPQKWETTGGEFNTKGSGNIKGYRPGVNYDPVADRIVVWDGGAVHALNMETKEWSHLAVAPQARFDSGTYGRFRYSPIENAYVVVNSSKQNVLIFKLTEGGGKR
ncbi:MAG: hypothetical protein GXP08_07315 [Gammaproteobacteria bacterium]|nr:hypothetical protein [Gammaproteobacteria bacterium]